MRKPLWIMCARLNLVYKTIPPTKMNEHRIQCVRHIHQPRSWGLVYYRFLDHNSNLMKISQCCNSTTHNTANKIAHFATAQPSCHTQNFVPITLLEVVSNRMETKWNFHWIWIVMKIVMDPRSASSQTNLNMFLLVSIWDYTRFLWF